MIKVLIAEKLSPKVIEHLKEIPEFDIFENNRESDEDFNKSIKNIDAIIIGDETIFSLRASLDNMVSSPIII